MTRGIDHQAAATTSTTTYTRISMTPFAQRKRAILAQIELANGDRSPKGSVDIQAWPIIRAINRHEDYVTTSSCSGRVAVFRERTSGETSGASGTSEDAASSSSSPWLYVSHDVPADGCGLSTFLREDQLCGCSTGTTDMNASVDVDNVDSDTLPANTTMISFKVEPFILHVEARTLPAARSLLQVALAAGYRNSGMVIGGGGEPTALSNAASNSTLPSGASSSSSMSSTRYMVAIRSTLKLDTPIGHLCPLDNRVHLVVSRAYMRILGTLARRKIQENFTRMEVLRERLIEAWSSTTVERGQEQGEEKQENVRWETAEERRMWKRREGLERQQRLKAMANAMAERSSATVANDDIATVVTSMTLEQ